MLKIGFLGILFPSPWLTDEMVSNNYHDGSGIRGQYPFQINHILLLMAIFLSGLQLMFGIFLNTLYNNPRAKRVCQIYELSHNDQELYTFKCLFKDRPIPIFTSIFISGWIFFSFAIKVAESSVPIARNPFIYYQNCFWYIGVTATTTGFGDITVKSDIGAFVSICCSVWGTFNVSIFFVLLLNMFRLGEN